MSSLHVHIHNTLRVLLIFLYSFAQAWHIAASAFERLCHKLCGERHTSAAEHGQTKPVILLNSLMILVMPWALLVKKKKTNKADVFIQPRADCASDGAGIV